MESVISDRGAPAGESVRPGHHGSAFSEAELAYLLGGRRLARVAASSAAAAADPKA